MNITFSFSSGNNNNNIIISLYLIFAILDDCVFYYLGYSILISILSCDIVFPVLLSLDYLQSFWKRDQRASKNRRREDSFVSVWDGSWCIYSFCSVFKTLKSQFSQFPLLSPALDDSQPKKILAFLLFESIALMGTSNLRLFFFSLASLCAMAAAKVVLIGNNITLSFDDIEANFGEFSPLKFGVSVLCI